MMFIRYSVKNFIGNLGFNLLLVVQLTVTLALISYSAFVFNSKYKYYSAFKDELNGKGVFLVAEDFLDGNDLLNDSSKLDEKYELEGVNSVYGMYSMLVSLPWDINSFIRAYDQILINKFIPDMSEGHWLNASSYSEECDYIEAVVSKNDIGIHAGDTFEIDTGTKKQGVKVVGVLEDGCSIYMTKDAEKYNAKDYSIMYWNHSFELDQKVLFLFNKKQIDDKNIPCRMSGNVMVNYDENISANQVAENMSRLFDKGAISMLENYDTILENSKETIQTIVFTFLPITLLVFLLSIGNELMITYINLDRTLHKFAIYQISGCSTRKCKIISLFGSCWGMVIAVFINCAAGVFLLLTDRLQWDTTLIKYNVGLYVIVVAVYLVINILYQNMLLSKSTTYQILRGDKND